jgi:hypothetical protein
MAGDWDTMHCILAELEQRALRILVALRATRPLYIRLGGIISKHITTRVIFQPLAAGSQVLSTKITCAASLV